MAQLPPKYPYGCNDKGLVEGIQNLSADVLKSGGNINTVMQLTPLITIGQNELLVRQFNRSNQTNKVVSRVAIAIAILSLFATIASVYYSHEAYKSSAEWQQSQLPILNNIREYARQQSTSTTVNNEAEYKILEQILFELQK